MSSAQVDNAWGFVGCSRTYFGIIRWHPHPLQISLLNPVSVAGGKCFTCLVHYILFVASLLFLIMSGLVCGLKGYGKRGKRADCMQGNCCFFLKCMSRHTWVCTQCIGLHHRAWGSDIKSHDSVKKDIGKLTGAFSFIFCVYRFSINR